MVWLHPLTASILTLSYGLVTLSYLCQAAQCPLEGKSFTIKSKVVVVYSNDSPRRESLLDESYSQEQRRAKIKYYIMERASAKNRKGRYTTGVFYLDTIRSMSAVLDETNLSAMTATTDDFYEVIGLGKLDIYDELDAPDYVVGPARLLFFLSNRREKQQLVELNYIVEVSNMKCLKYTLFHNTKSGEKLKFTIYYSELALASDPQSFPVQVIIEFLDAGRELFDIIIDYSPIESVISPYSILPNSKQHHRVQLDWFTFNPMRGFSSLFGSTHQGDIFAKIPSSTAKFSFKAVVERENGAKSTRFVAFDAKLDTLVQRPKWSDTSTSGLTQLVFNFKLNRMYHIVTRMPNSRTVVDRVLRLSQKDMDDDADGVSDNTQCVVSKILPNFNMGSPVRPLSIGKILVGANKFVYLGHARVRGIPALVYEVSEASLPFWLDHNLVYKNAEPGTSPPEAQRSLYHAIDEKSGESSTTVLLFMEDGSTTEPNLLMLEVFIWDLKYNYLIDKQTVHFYDFKWELDYDGNPASLFSLQDLCSSGLGKNQYALVKLLLERDGSSSIYKETDSYSVGADRAGTNLALLASLQENLKLPAPMIYDMSWHIAEGVSKTIDNGKHLLLATSFRMAEHVDNLVELVYLGHGVLNYRKRKQDAGLYTLHTTRTVAGCYFLAAHRRKNVFFAYEPVMHDCYVDLSPIEDDSKDYPPHFLELPEGNMEVYRVNHVQDVGKVGSDSWMQDIYQAASQLHANQASLIGTTMLLLDVTPDHGSLEFVVKQAEVDERSVKASAPSKGNDNSQDLTSDRIDGFGLVAKGDLSRRIGPTPINVDHWKLTDLKEGDQSAAISREQCEAACLRDSTCRSYSVCIEESELKCVISKASFKSPDVIKQLSIDQKSKISLNRNVQVKLDDGQVVELNKHPNCELNNVAFLNHFFKPKVVRNTFTNRYIYPVKDQEDCAEMCIRQSIDLLREDIAHHIESAQSVFDRDSSSSGDYGRLRTLLAEHRQATKQICRTFFYIDKARMLNFPKDLADRIQDYVVRDESNESDRHLIGLANKDHGFCVMVDPVHKKDGQATDQSTSKVSEYIDIEMYSFKFDLFYEKQYGVRLLGTKMDGLQIEAQKLATLESREITDEHLSALKTFVQDGQNSQDMIQATASKCATVCFLQTWGPWPACRSFDIVMENVNKSPYTKCYLNSITLQQAITTQRLDLIDDSSESQAWHYEPRQGFVVDESNLAGNLKLSELSSSLIRSSAAIKLNFPISLLVAMVAIASGLYAGLQVSKAYIDRRISPTRIEHDMLVMDQ